MNWHDYFTYNPETGDLIWKEREAGFFSSNMNYAIHLKKAGDVAGHRAIEGKGRRKAIMVMVWREENGKRIKKNQRAHRIIWNMVYGEIAKGFIIDHIDGNPWNNKLKNLRLISPAGNSRNSTPGLVSATGLRGVVKTGSTWKAYITILGRRTYIGSYPLKCLAGLARCKYELSVFGKDSTLYRKFIIKQNEQRIQDSHLA